MRNDAWHSRKKVSQKRKSDVEKYTWRGTVKSSRKEKAAIKLMNRTKKAGLLIKTYGGNCEEGERSIYSSEKAAGPPPSNFRRTAAGVMINFLPARSAKKPATARRTVRRFPRINPDATRYPWSCIASGYSSRVMAHCECISRVLCYCISLHGRTGRGTPVAYPAQANW